MIKNHPLLTSNNINYWYWECDPSLSQYDIAREIGCSTSTVSRFMAANGIPTKALSDAIKNAFRWDDKGRTQFEEYDLLTVENLIKWYWKSDPAWSLEDIGEKVGCSGSTVQSFMIFSKIPRRDTAEASRNMHKCPKHRPIRRFPELTTENVHDWYWKMNPPWSISDIAKQVGCTYGNVQSFMIRHNIPRRNHKMAAKNIHRCPLKHKNYSYEDPQKKKALLKVIRKGKENLLTQRQKEILLALSRNPGLTTANIKSLPYFKEIRIKLISGSLRCLFNRDLVKREKILFRGNVYQYKYKMIEKGYNVLKTHLSKK